MYNVHISGTETWHIPLHLLQLWLAWFLFRDSDYFWDSVGFGYQTTTAAIVTAKIIFIVTAAPPSVLKFTWWRYCSSALCDEISTISLNLTKLYIEHRALQHRHQSQTAKSARTVLTVAPWQTLSPPWVLSGWFSQNLIHGNLRIASGIFPVLINVFRSFSLGIISTVLQNV